MNPETFLHELQSERAYRGQLVHVEPLPPRAARYGTLARPLPDALHKALRALGVSKFYTHQAETIDHARRGYDVIVATGTASGKTLCYNLPTLEAVLRDPQARALYLFPTKALAQDQLRALGALQAQLPPPRFGFGAYDGDTPREQRAALRKSAHIVLTNPDMLSVGILPNHALWEQFLRHLRFVVIDEAHVYRGVFGSQVACVLRRLRRLCAHYGAQPQFILCSATIANAGEHAQRLTGRAAHVVDSDGAPRSRKAFALWNPPFLDRARSTRRSANVEAAYLLTRLVQANLRNITFTRTRKSAELILAYAREQLRELAPKLADKIGSYRAGYLPAERRAIERTLFNGDLRAVTATNSLELGVDIGHLDATVLVGYPGTIASLWQQAGRAGRGARDALSILVGEDEPLNQFFMHHPDALFARPIEHALIYPDNPYILEKHLPCAAFELPLTNDDEDLFGPGFVDAMIRLERTGTLLYANERWYYQSAGAAGAHGRTRDYPAEAVSLRAASSRRVKLVKERQPRSVIEEMDAALALRRAHEGAIYLHQGESYLVTKLDLRAGVAHLRPVDVAYYTEPREVGQTYIVRARQQRRAGATRAYFGDVRVSQRIVGYRRIRTDPSGSDRPFGFPIPEGSNLTLVEVELDYPAQSFETKAVWWDIPIALVRELQRERCDFAGALHAVEHACTSLLPLFAMCDRWDIGGLSSTSHPDTEKPQVFIYDAFEGGIGISEKGYSLLESLWQAALETIEACACESGCPACIQSPRCGTNNQPLDKRGAAILLRGLLQS